MRKLLVCMPDLTMSRLRALVPDRKRSKFISELVDRELDTREQALYECALRVENDQALNAEMAEWEGTVGDGLS